jgi:murein DD-endopeptidase MepM/ murein hydrolase activator NlpD
MERLGAQAALLFLGLKSRLEPHGPPDRIERARLVQRLEPKRKARATEPRGRALSARGRVLAGLAAALVTIVALAFVLILAQGPFFPIPQSGLLPAEDSLQEILLNYVSPELDGPSSDGGQAKAPAAPLILQLSTYTARGSDSLQSIAKRFGLNIDTLVSVNSITSSSPMRSGSQLKIPNIDGLAYKVRGGDSLSSIARRFKADTTRIVDANDLGSAQLTKGMNLFIPGARLPDSDLRQALGPSVSWPVRGPLTSFFGYRPDPFTGVRRFHAGIDIAVDMGTPVHAALAGTVADTGYNGDFGNYVILSHPDGFQTLYGHLTSSSVTDGQKIDKGEVLGRSGNTGYSTGPHVHFGLFRRGMPLNPLKYLK